MGWEFFNKNVQYKVGVGDKVKLWKDRWCGDLPLNLSYFFLYHFAANREASVQSSLICHGAGDRRIWMFASIEVLMIGRQMWWTSSYVSWHPICLQGLRVIV